MSYRTAPPDANTIVKASFTYLDLPLGVGGPILGDTSDDDGLVADFVAFNKLLNG